MSYTDIEHWGPKERAIAEAIRIILADEVDGEWASFAVTFRGKRDGDDTLIDYIDLRRADCSVNRSRDSGRI